MSTIIDGSNGVTFPNGETINGNVDASLVTFVQSGTGAVSRTAQDKMREAVSVKDFGAVGDGVTDDTSTIQAAIDYVSSLGVPAKVIVPAGHVFILSVAARSGIAAGVAGLVLKSNVTLVLDGTLKAKAGIYGVGTLSALIKTADVGVSNAGIVGTGIIDGNKANQTASVQCDNIYLRAVSNVTVSGISSINANGNGILITKAVSGSNHTDVSVTGTVVSVCNTIGIQVSHSASNLVIANNRVSSCTDNCIDVYNENGTTTTDPGVVSITGNTVTGGLVGIFPETTSNCSVTGNSISSCTYAGISTNRINGAPSNIVISNNNITGCPRGIIGSGDSSGVLICTNTVAAFDTAGVLLTGTTVASYTVHGNVFSPSATTTPVISISGTSLVRLQVFNNVCLDASHNTAYGVVTSGTLSLSTLEPIIYSTEKRPVKRPGAESASSGGTSTISVPAYSAGKLVIYSTSGGGWHSVWSGSFISGASRVTVAQESSTFTSPGNCVSSVAGSASTLNITVNWASPGSGIQYNYWVEYVTG